MDQEDKELLEELLEKRNSSDEKNKTLQNLVDNEGRNNNFFSLNGVYTVVVSVISVIVMGTIWWVNINYDINELEKRFEKNNIKIEEQVKQTNNSFNDINVQIGQIEKNINSLKNRLNNHIKSQKEKKQIFDEINNRNIERLRSDIIELKRKIDSKNEELSDSKVEIEGLKYQLRELEKKLE